MSFLHLQKNRYQIQEGGGLEYVLHVLIILQVMNPRPVSKSQLISQCSKEIIREMGKLLKYVSCSIATEKSR